MERRTGALQMVVMSALILFVGQLARGGEDAGLVAVLVSGLTLPALVAVATHPLRINPLFYSTPILPLSLAMAFVNNEPTLSLLALVTGGLGLGFLCINVLIWFSRD